MMRPPVAGSHPGRRAGLKNDIGMSEGLLSAFAWGSGSGVHTTSLGIPNDSNLVLVRKVERHISTPASAEIPSSGRANVPARIVPSPVLMKPDTAR